MRAKIFYISVFTFFFSLPIFAQKVTVNVFMENYKNFPESDTIYYNFNTKLNWADFQGKVPPSVPWGAETASGFSFHSSMNSDENNINISVGIYTFFTKHDSWKKPNINSAYQLEHEQHHFDITRLSAAKLESEIRKAHFTHNNYKSLLNSIFNKVYNDEIQLQKKYDLETKNSLETAKQLEWNKKISEEIEKLKSANLQ